MSDGIIRSFICIYCKERWETSDGFFPDKCPFCECDTVFIKEKSVKGN